jgi:hypothetical protein
LNSGARSHRSVQICPGRDLEVLTALRALVNDRTVDRELEDILCGIHRALAPEEGTPRASGA